MNVARLKNRYNDRHAPNHRIELDREEAELDHRQQTVLQVEAQTGLLLEQHLLSSYCNYLTMSTRPLAFDL